MQTGRGLAQVSRVMCMGVCMCDVTGRRDASWSYVSAATHMTTPHTQIPRAASLECRTSDEDTRWSMGEVPLHPGGRGLVVQMSRD